MHINRILMRTVHHKPFRKVEGKREFLWWEGVYIFRRFILILVVTFVQNQILRSFLLLAIQVVFLLHHLYCKPFNNKILNSLESASLFTLVIFSSMNSIHVHNSVSESSKADFDVYRGFLWTKLILIVAIPCIFCFIICGILLLLLFNFIFKSIKYLSVKAYFRIAL